MSELTTRRCEACEAGTPPLDMRRAEELYAQLDPSWKLDEKKLTRKFEFKNFKEAFSLASRVADLAEEEGHHPDLEISWGRLGVTLTTHAAGGLTDNDFIMAAKIDQLAA